MTARIKITDSQKWLVVDYMENHPLMARRQITKLGEQGRAKYKSMWIDAALLFNNHGPVKKSPKEWEAFWTDWRLGAKQRKALYLRGIGRTGNNWVAPLDELDDRVCNIFGKHGIGLSIISEKGFINNKVLLSGIQNQNESRKKISLSKAQISIMCTFMEQHSGVARGIAPDSTAEVEWETLQTLINSIAVKDTNKIGSIDELKMDWSTLVSQARKRRREYLYDPSKSEPLSVDELKVVRALKEEVPSLMDRLNNINRMSLARDSDQCHSQSKNKKRKYDDLIDCDADAMITLHEKHVNLLGKISVHLIDIKNCLYQVSTQLQSFVRTRDAVDAEAEPVDLAVAPTEEESQPIFVDEDDEANYPMEFLED